MDRKLNYQQSCPFNKTMLVNSQSINCLSLFDKYFETLAAQQLVGQDRLAKNLRIWLDQ